MKKLAFILLGILSFIYGYAQMIYPQSLMSSSNQQLIEKALNNALFISQQSFQICDRETGELFGLNGKKEFGIQYSLGIKVPGGFLLNDEAVRPWVYNDKYKKYQNKYDPVFYQAKFSELSEEAKYDSLGYTLVGMQELVDTMVYSLSSETFDNKGFVLDYTIGEKEGWAVWLTTDKATDLSQTTKLNYTIYRKKIVVEKIKQSFEIAKPDVGQDILGGIYVVPYYTEIGIVEFRLCGVMSKSKGGWKIHCPFVGMEDEISSGQKPNQEEELKEEDEDASELTPVGKGKNKDKKKRKK